MRPIHWLALLPAFLLFACQPATANTVTILDRGQITTLRTEERVPSALLSQAGITLGPNDRVLVNGFPAPLDRSVSVSPMTIQIRRAVAMTLVLPDGEKKIVTQRLTPWARHWQNHLFGYTKEIRCFLQPGYADRQTG